MNIGFCLNILPFYLFEETCLYVLTEVVTLFTCFANRGTKRLAAFLGYIDLLELIETYTGRF
jgi:hypothetical protein